MRENEHYLRMVKEFSPSSRGIPSGRETTGSRDLQLQRKFCLRCNLLLIVKCSTESKILTVEELRYCR